MLCVCVAIFQRLTSRYFCATFLTFFRLFCSKASRRPNRCSRFSDSQTAQPRTHPRHLPPALSRNRRPPAKTHSHPRRLRSRPKRLRQMTQNLARRKLLSVVMTPIVMTMTMNLCSQKLIWSSLGKRSAALQYKLPIEAKIVYRFSALSNDTCVNGNIVSGHFFKVYACMC